MAQVAWNKGLKGNEYKKHFKNGMGGQFEKDSVPWNKYKTGYSLSNKGKPGNPASGFKKGHPNYNKGSGKTELNKAIRVMRNYLEWRSSVLERDNYHCQNCGDNESLEVHHIIQFAKIVKEFGITTPEQARNCKALWDIGNGITYCRKCHILIDENIGKSFLSKENKLNNIGGTKKWDKIT